MGNTTVADVLGAARDLVDDGVRSINSDQLFGLVRASQADIAAKLRTWQVDRLRVRWEGVQVAGVTTILTSAFPSYFVTPMMIWERAVGQDETYWRPMIRVPELPNRTMTDYFQEWDYYYDAIHFVGCTRDMELRLEGMGRPAFLESVGDTLILPDAHRALSYLAASKYVRATARKAHPNDIALAQSLAADAESAILDLAQVEVQQEQSMPTRRIPFGVYRRGPFSRE